jgi:perosamine synthetase
MLTNSNKLFKSLSKLIRDIFGDGDIPLHRPVFEGNEKVYVSECIDTNFVSSVGSRVKDFETSCMNFTNAKYAVATVNGTSALHAALLVAGVQESDEVITQALTFVATCNAITYCGARPVFIDVDIDTMGLSPEALDKWLSLNVVKRDGCAYNRKTGARVSACVPMHTFGIPLRIASVVDICKSYGIRVVEDAAESLGSFVGKKHTGLFGDLGTLSFNGNKVITTGGGGMILTDDRVAAQRALHLTTTAKIPHSYEFIHDEVGYNYRLPNINAALGCAQMERLQDMLVIKSKIADEYRSFCATHALHFVEGITGSTPNYWLNAIILSGVDERDLLLRCMNRQGIMLRPIWRLMSKLKMFEGCQADDLQNSHWLEDRVVNVPSSVPVGFPSQV